ncbi:MAG: glycosyltransferase [Deltaproteobacteria bacterium]|nr:glycosyltransferase [Deltaproteobacteria bacterium]
MSTQHHELRSLRGYSLLCDAENLARGMALIESIFEHEDDEHRIYALCLDEETRDAMRTVRMPQLVPLMLAEVAPTAQTVPELMLALLRRGTEIDTLIHLSTERYLVGPTASLAEGSAAVELWRVSPEGPIDTGLIVVRRTHGGEATLEAWVDAEARGEAELESLAGVSIGFDPRRTFGPDDLASRDVYLADGCAMFGDAPLLAFDSASVRMFSPELFSVEVSSGSLTTPAVYRAVLLPFVDAVSRAAAWERAVTGGIRGARPPSELSSTHELITVRGVRERVLKHGLPNRCVALSPVWDVHLSEQRGEVSFDDGFVTKRVPCPVSHPILRSNEQGSVRVSALVSTYNAEHVFRGCMDDLVAQTLFTKGELEIVIIDSASPTGELSIAREYAERYPNVVVVRSSEREGVYMAWNRAAALARGRYLTNANTDDRHRAHALERMADALDREPAAGLVYADSDITRTPNVGPDSAPIVGRFRWPEFERGHLLKGCHIGPHPMWRRSLHDVVGWFDARYLVAGDYDMWLRFAEHVELRHLPETLGLYLERDDSVEHANADRCTLETTSIVGLYRLRFDAARFLEGARTAPLSVGHSVPPPGSSPSSAARPSRPRASEGHGVPNYSCSIVWLVPDNLAAAEHGLEAFVSNTPRYIPHEVVLAVRRGSSELRAFLAGLAGDVSVREFPPQLDVLEAWRRAAEAASSEVIVLVDGATSVSEGWLDPLLRNLEREPRNGAVAGRKVKLGATVGAPRDRIGAIALARELLCLVPAASGPGSTTHTDAAVRLFRALHGEGLPIAQEHRSSVVASAPAPHAPGRASA